MNNRISGDFGTDALEAFRAAYAQREVKPEDLEVDKYTGLPTGEITNISPWIEHTGLWRANPGTDRAFVPNQMLEEEEDFEDELSEDDFNRMVDEVLSDLEEEDRFANEIFNGDDDDTDEEEDEVEDEELEALINSILSENEEDEPEDIEDSVEVATEEEIDALIQEIMEEIEQEELEEEREAESNRDVTNDELEEMISDLEPEEPMPNTDEVEEEEVGDDEIDNLVEGILNETPGEGDDEAQDALTEQVVEDDGE